MLLFIVVIVFILIAAGIVWFLLGHDHGEKEPVSALWVAAGFGLLGAITAGVLENLIIPPRFSNNTLQPLGGLFLAMLGVGIIEEACKFLPLALFIYRKSYFNEHTDGIIYFAIAGLAFGVPENILYSVIFGAGTGVVRIILTPIFHAATTSMVGYFLVSAKIEHKRLTLTGLALAGAMLLHGLYDFGLSSQNPLFVVMSLMITVGMSTVFFVLFMRAGEVDQAMGLNKPNRSNFCRSCGSPNPSHSLFCTHCGQHA